MSDPVPITGFLQTGGKKITYSCGYCSKNITNSCRIRCADLACFNFDLCGDCFAAGVNLLPHQSNHSYRVVDSLEFTIFSKDWTATEELLLLEGIEKHGVGNWKTISEYIGTKHTKQCEEHYWDAYLGTVGRCLPSKTLIGDRLVDTDELLVDSSQTNSVELGLTVAPPEMSIGQQVLREKTKDLTRNGKKEMDLREKIAQLPGSDLPGFMPLREDFDFEYENNAEQILADMEFCADDHESEVALKLDVIKIYNKKLEERDKRKRFVIDRGIVDIKRTQLLERKRSKEDKDIISRCNMLSRFHSIQEHDSLMSGITLARRLRKQIELFAHYRKLGIRTLDEAREYEIRKRKREQEIKLKSSKQGNSLLGSSLPAPTTGLDRPAEGHPLKRSALARDDSAGYKWAYADNKKILEKDAPDGNLLSERELELCCRLGILPKQYLAIQSVILREAFRNGTLTRDGVSRVLKTNPATGEILYDFFIRDLRDVFSASMPAEEPQCNFSISLQKSSSADGTNDSNIISNGNDSNLVDVPNLNLGVEELTNNLVDLTSSGNAINVDSKALNIDSAN